MKSAVVCVALWSCLLAAAQPVPDARQIRDLATDPATTDDIKALFPEDACKDLAQAGQICMPPVLTPVFSLPAGAFGLGSARMPDVIKGQLDRFAQVLSGRHAVDQALKIVGHTDASGSVRGNLVLSQRRAASVKDYLVAKGVDPVILVTEGAGSTQPIANEDPRAAANRRVTMSRLRAGLQ